MRTRSWVVRVAIPGSRPQCGRCCPWDLLGGADAATLVSVALLGGYPKTNPMEFRCNLRQQRPAEHPLAALWWRAPACAEPSIGAIVLGAGPRWCPDRSLGCPRLRGPAYHRIVKDAQEVDNHAIIMRPIAHGLGHPGTLGSPSTPSGHLRSWIPRRWGICPRGVEIPPDDLD